jgi:hypothetical protein
VKKENNINTEAEYWLGVRLSQNGKLVERVTIKIKMFDTGKWEWKVRQIFHKEPRIKLDDFIKILDEIKAEVRTIEGVEEPKPEQQIITQEKQPGVAVKKQGKKKKKTAE